MRAKVNKVRHVVLLVKDVMTSVKFYSEVLGMEVVDLKENHMRERGKNKCH